MRPKQSHQVVESRVAQEITRMVNSSEKSQYDISVEMGLAKSNFLTMLKQGRSKLPLDKVIPLAKACDADPAHLMVLCLEEYQPQVLDALSEAFRATITASEAAIMRSIRHAKQVKENDKRDAAGMNAMTRAEKASAGLVRAGYRTSPEQLRKVYEFALKNLVE